MNASRNNLTSIFVGLALTILFAFLVNPPIPVIKQAIERLEGIVYDVRLNATLPEQTRTTDFNIFVVDIDEKSLEEVGRFPWTRTKVKELVSNLVDAGVVVIGFDIAFSEPELNPVDKVLNSQLSSQLNFNNSELVSQLRQELDADRQLASVLGDTDIVLGILFQDDRSVQVGTLKPSTIRIDNPAVTADSLTRRVYNGQLSNVDVVQQAAIGQGFFNSAPDPDGYIRRAFTVVEHNNQFYSSLALEAARLYSLADEVVVETQAIGKGRYSISAVKFGNFKIPTDEYGRVLIPYRGEQKSFPYFSATDILHNRINAEKLENGIALIGTSAVGLADLRATPVGLQYPGVEVHANVLEGLLQATQVQMQQGQKASSLSSSLFSYRPDYWQAASYLQIIIFGLILSLVMPKFGPANMALLALFSVIVVIAVNLYLWQSKVEMPVLPQLALVLSISIYNLTRGFFAESSNRQQIKSMFDQYVPPAHIDKMLDDPNSISLDGERKEMSVLFSDIRSFTSISEQLSANELKDMLNEYFSPITQSIFEHQGTIDKYVGDMVMAFWGAPLDDANHAEHAVLGGFDMLKITAQLRAQFVAKGWPAIHVGIGINTGHMNVGDMGSQYRRAYTVLGDAVNLGSRLEGLTKFYGLAFLVSEFTQQQCPNIAFRPVDKVKVKGKDEAVAIFEPVSLKSELSEQQNAELNLLTEAYSCYLSQQWSRATELYQELQANSPETYLYQLYIERIEQLKEANLAEDWDGSFTHTAK